MKNKKIIIGLMIAALCLAAGCQSKTEEEASLEAEIMEDEVSMETEDSGTQNSRTKNSETEDIIVDTEAEKTEGTDTKTEDTDTEAQKQKNSTENNSDSQSVKEEISGMVKGVGDNSATVSQIFTMDTEDGLIAVSPASEDGNENILSIYFNVGAEYEFNIIRDGGGNVESREGSFEDIKKGMILHMTGNWDGNDFYADIISINEVR
ncbi:hypothetical protein EDD76_12078 [Kineothrix alysoides]|uniref:Uncharacterized protein n=1 Tax=Kineothrix alysoides TaxID=1469948 RepID=A0A4R1QU85_9FIRM|nr:hypothetical protein [Kineothrix alysoides]TCL54474.1 hypothetical protein EDD76_12078 [Kineothrix alysoides]